MSSKLKNVALFVKVISYFNRIFYTVYTHAAQDAEDLERPRKRRRRNSDSNLYCKARDEEIEKGKKEAEAKYLDSEKYAFVQSYLQNIETHSITETSDSGIRTRGEPSDFEMQDISGKYNLLF